MKEFVMYGEEDMEVLLQEEERRIEIMDKEEEIHTSLNNSQSWCLPKLSLRVLLVESDASTRQIISALLRRCGYSVTAVPDGLKAWETLKGRPHNINLVLTEVELPSISGFALLTLIMEQETCKNIPVIMMSSHDSVNVVFKCMLRGAADFLIKPVRKNELRNLWQHVWRRQSSTGVGHRFQERNLVERKFEAISENNAASNHSSDYVACSQKNEEGSEKGSDAQSSCTKPDVEAERAYVNNIQDLMQPKCRSLSPVSDMKKRKHEDCTKLDELVHGNQAEDKSNKLESEVTLRNEANNSTELILEKEHTPRAKDVALESRRETANIDNYEPVKPSREAIDLIGSFDKHSRHTYGLTHSTVVEEALSKDAEVCSALHNCSAKLDSTPLLELSLKRFHPSDSENQGHDEWHSLNHSNVSAFSLYTNRMVQPLCQTSASLLSVTKECANNSYRHPSNQGPPCNTTDAREWNGPVLNNNQESRTSIVVDQSGQAETSLPCPRLGVIHIPVPVRGMGFDSFCSGYGAVLQPVYHAQAIPPPVWSPNSATQKAPPAFHANSFHHLNLETHGSEQGCHLHDQNFNASANQTVHEQQEQKLASMDNSRHISPATGQSASSSVCNGASTTSHLNSGGCGSNYNGSNGKFAPATVARSTAESGNDEGLVLNDGIRGTDSHHSIQREVALTKFRLKRKDRCFEKKVRYQSRKRLAEQRPRVKGQFVRQVPADSPSAETEPS